MPLFVKKVHRRQGFGEDKILFVKSLYGTYVFPVTFVDVGVGLFGRKAVGYYFFTEISFLVIGVIVRIVALFCTDFP